MYPSPGYVISTPRILPVVLTSSNILPTFPVLPSLKETAVPATASSSSCMKFPSITLPAPPSPPPPKN